MNRQILFASFFLFLIACGGDKKSEEKKQFEVSPDIVEVTEKDDQIIENVENPVLIDGKLDIEQLGEDINLEMDISSFSLYEIRILRNSFAAKQGYCFMKGDLRYTFGATSWYNERMENRYWAEEGGKDIAPISYSDQETVFIEKLKKREEELKLKNLVKKGNRQLANVNNVVNLFQLNDPAPELMSMLSQNGFAIVLNNNIQLFHLYEQNDYAEFPNFVTTDMYMQLFHMYFGYILRQIEEEQFIAILSQICESMIKDMQEIAKTTPNESIKEIAKFNHTYYAIAYTVLTNKKIEVPLGYEQHYENELVSIKGAEDSTSKFLEFEEVNFPYSLFKPRGHYTRTETLKRYFSAMMWLQSAPFCLNNDLQFKRALVNASVLGNSPNFEKETLRKYKAIMEPINFIIGQPDNVSFLDLVDLIEKEELPVEEILHNTTVIESMKEEVKKMAEIKDKIRSGGGSCKIKINFIPQRYLSDNDVLQNLVDLKSKVSKRPYPQGLDVMAAFGSESAENLLLNELKEGEKWSKYPELLSDMQKEMKDLDWNETLYTKWIQSLLELQKPNDSYPYFMQTTEWDKKNLNASLASWAELKHDSILYAEQPMAAECGSGEEVPSPYTVGYVEPNIGYWNTVIELIDLTKSVLERNKLLNSNISRITTGLRENAEFLLSASTKELAGKKLSVQEYGQIEIIGSTFEWLTLDLVKQKDQYLDGWHNVKGADKSVAIVADIYTANGENNPDKGILHVATGNVNDIYAVVEIEGYLYITKGAVFGYHEFHLPMGNRLTDEEWQEMLENNEATGIPIWMKDIIVPIPVPKTNEKIFYSSGC
ncbi:DUF3160 domain-containing protein [Aquimarina sp. MMG015]|uniref:DUF3160 domain-containing protein n=1 Tax=Aquimarina sp. MMG015 TaxID=2822689 RepID=UPI001B3A1F90|nr:DUF3160 domain-containing protein [Aquimarina sp. MMG015]MBQ4805685.1 DUF3160 domain-containing protein [Aquimarina sp. MMG015]